MGLFGKKANSAAAQMSKGLQDEKKKFEIIVNSIDDGVILIDGEGVIQMCNPAGSTITGWPADEAVGITVQRVMVLLDPKGNPVPSHASPFTQVFQTGSNSRDPKAVLNARGNHQVAITLSVNPIKDEAGQVTAAIAVFRDVSQERAEEQQRADFISTASHEMRTPVAAIEGYLSLALNEKVANIDTRARDYLEKAHASTQHLGQLFQDLLTSAKAEDGRLTSHPSVVELGAYLKQLSEDLRLVAEKKGLVVSFEMSTGQTINATREAGEKVVQPLYYVYADADRLREVLTNLFDNAVKYTPEGKISLGITGNANVVQCFVRDTGPGIPADDIPHLFQKFYRVDNSATRTIGGTGLGLFICRKIIELYQGRIWVESELGKGSTFYINLPRLSPQKAAEMHATKLTTPQAILPEPAATP